jgi:hypothetical protein
MTLLRALYLVPLTVLLLSSANEDGQKGQETWGDSFRILPKRYTE